MHCDHRRPMTSQPFPLTSRFSEALSSAATLHAGQYRKGTPIPYLGHLLATASIALSHGADEDEAIAALLHDSIEDAPEHLGADWVRRWLEFKFGRKVLEIVNCCTDADIQPKPSWLQRKETYVARIAGEPRSVLLVSASDKLHNAAAILSDFRQVGDEVWKRFNQTAGKAGTIGYYRGLTSAYQQTGHHRALIEELHRTVSLIEQEAQCAGVWPVVSA